MSDARRPLKNILCLWLPNWPIQRAQAVEPHLAQRPLVLTRRDPRRGLVVSAANRLARAAGVRPDMRLAEATGLTELEMRQHDPAEDGEALSSLCEQAQQFSPLVGIEPLDHRLWAGRWLHQPECLLLDITGLEHLFGGYANLLSQIGGWLEQQNYFGCMAVGTSVGTAWALANYALRNPEPTAMDPPAMNPASCPPAHRPGDLSAIPRSRYLLLTPQQQQRQVAELPLAALRIDEATIHTLRRLGLFRIGQLANLPRTGLANRLGESLLLRWDQACGIREEPILGLHNQPDWTCGQELEVPTDRTETITELTRRAISNLANRMESRGEGAVRIVCRFDLVDHPSLVLQLGLFRPTCDQPHLNMLMGSLLERHLPHQMKAPLWRLSATATLTAPLVWRQADLFDSSQAAYRHQMAGLIDMLSARLGRKQVLRARVQRESQPELAAVLQPLTGVRRDNAPTTSLRKFGGRLSPRTAEPQREDPLRRPTRLLQPPLSIEVVGYSQPLHHGHDGSAGPVSGDRPGAGPFIPTRVKTANGWHQIVSACGPERLESGWWKGPSCRRDYYRIATHQGSWWWIYRDLNAGKWYLHGLFD